ncbi:phage integrase N-terminal SAM-like domain-containing protein [Methanolobus sp.]|jgi:site-specific recombinase XerD|uniref:phage integrase N-terminal SAM-like domain-containing protein n=1 Tax=Methanolobus sp. TaxID=1874737 RepID=UPI0025F5EBD8|nr:phage integrase N-terminal SAM-like domain-containing protein [Methanolobus sp.]
MVRNYEKLVLQHIDSIENPMQQETIKRYVRYCKDQNQSIRTISGKVHTIKAIGAYYRDKAFEDLTKDYIEDYIDSDAFRCNSQPGRNEISQSTLGYYGINIRSFFKWVHFRGAAQMKKKGLYPECVDWMEIKQVQKITTPDQLFISILYDTSGRLGEIPDQGL